MSTVNRSSLKRLLSFGRLGSREVQHDQASISRGGGCSVTLEDLKGIATDQTGVKRLEPIKLVASVLFHPTGACDVFLELEIANPQKLPLELGEIAFSVLPRPDRCQCRSELFSEEPANKEPNWSSMFRNYRPDDIRRDHRFTYTLTTYPHAKPHEQAEKPCRLQCACDSRLLSCERGASNRISAPCDPARFPP